MKYLKTLNELRNQGELPFDGGDPIKDKPTHIHLIDAIQYLSQKNKINLNNLTTKNNNLDSYYNEYFDKGFQLFSDDLAVEEVERYQKYFMEEYSNNKDYFHEPPITHNEFEEFITDEGIEIFTNEFIKDYFINNINEYDFMDEIEQNDKGLVKIWRAITLDESDDIKDAYEKIIDYKGVGIFWSWDMDGAYPHAGFNKFKDNKDYGFFILSAWVKPEDINWTRTILKNGWDLREEREIEVNDNAMVMIDSLYKHDGFKQIKFHEGQYVVKT